MRVSLDKIFTVLFSVLCFSLAFIGDQFYAVPNGINILLVAIFPFVINKKNLEALVFKKPTVWFVIFLSFVLIKSILLGQFLEDLSVIKKLFQTLLIIILSSGLKFSSREWLKFGIVLGSLAAVFYSLVKITLLIINTASFNFAEGPVINETLPVQRLYLGLLCTTSLILVLERFFKKRKKINLLLALIFTVFIFLIAARIAIITIILVLLYYLQSKLRRKLKIIALFSVLFLAFFIISNTPSLSKRILHSDHQVSDTYFEKIQKHEPRYIIWKHSLSLIDKNHALFGYGFEGYQNKLLKKYEQIPQLKKREWFIQEQFNSHNQFLDILLSQGLFGLIIFLLFIYYLFKESLASDTKFLLLFSVIMFFTVYNNFHRVIGVFIFALIYSLIVPPQKVVHK